MGELKPCPFCGGEAEIERLGDQRRSTIYRCTECSCLLETGEEWNHGARWNSRPHVEEALARIAALTELLRELEKAADKVAYDIAYYGSRVDDAVLRTNVRRIAGNARALTAKITTTLAAVPMTGETK